MAGADGRPGWIDVSLDRDRGREAPTWRVLAERYERCIGRVSFYLSARVRDRGLREQIVAETLARNAHLLVDECDELKEIRCLHATCDLLIAHPGAVPPQGRGA